MARRYRIARTYKITPVDGQVPVKLALVLEGAPANASFEAGVAFELLTAAGRGAPITIDLVVGSAAAALVSAMVAKSLVTGASPEHLLPHLSGLTLSQLTQSLGIAPDRGPLPGGKLHQVLEQYVAADPMERSFQPVHPAHRVILVVSLCNLDGITDPSTGISIAGEAVTFRFVLPDPQRLYRSPVPTAVWKRVAAVGRAAVSSPGLFEPQKVPWAERIAIPGLIEEVWRNQAILERLHRTNPTLQPSLRYADGNLLGNQALHIAPQAIREQTAGPAEASVYVPHRYLLSVQSVRAPAPARTGRENARETWVASLLKAFRLRSSNGTGRDGSAGILSNNQRHERVLQFLARMARQMRERGQIPPVAEAVGQFQPGASAINADASLEEAIQAFYGWLADDIRYDRDMLWIDRRPPGPGRDVHRGIRQALGSLREAYLALRELDPVPPNRYQAAIRSMHLALSSAHDLHQPWVALHTLAPDRPERISSLLSVDALRYDFHAGRQAAYRWLKEVLPGAPPGPPPPQPVPVPAPSWRVMVRNVGPLLRIAGRVLSVLLEAAGLPHGGGAQLVVKLVAAALLIGACTLLAVGLFALIT